MAIPKYQQRGKGHSNNRGKSKGPVPGSTLPQSMREELDMQEADDRKFGKNYVNKAANRKELRKQKRADKGKRKLAHQQLAHMTPQQRQQAAEPPRKKQKTIVQPGVVPKKVAEKAPPSKKAKSSEEALKQFSKSNPHLYSLLEQDDLVQGSNSKTAFAQDDKEIAYWEKKLGLNKKNGKLGKAFEEDGLLDILGGSLSDDHEMDDQEYLRQKRQKKLAERSEAKLAEAAEQTMDDLFNDFESSGSEEEDDEEDQDEDDDEMEGLYSDEEHDLASGDDLDDESDEEELDEAESENESDENEEEGDSTSTSATTTPSNIPAEKPVDSTPAVVTKYVPPHLRKAASSKSEQQIRLQRTLQGLFNRLSETNMESIMLEIEKCYGNYPRHDVTATTSEIILTSIATKSNLLDSFVIIYATVVGSLFRLVGVEFAAHHVQELVEMFEKNFKQCRDMMAAGVENDDEAIPGARECRNLLTLLLELYNFQVISCILVFDIVRVLIKHLDEYCVELLLRIIRTAGAQMRADDPAALKDIIDEIQKETAKRDPSSISMRHKFMLETLTNIKNNKIKNGVTASGQGDKELVQKMKKYLNGLGKKRTIRTSEPLRVSLDDIHQIETKGKWWLVGASWKDNLVGTESKYASSKMANDLRKDQSLQETLLKIARKQGMNTDIRRSIFVTVMSAEDYLDAFEKLMKLSLTEIQQREIARVLIQCTGNEKSFNPFYVLVSRRLCESNHSFKVTYQYCLWDFLRDCGETEVGGLDRSSTESAGDHKNIRLSRIVNIAKFYASLIANHALSLAVLKSVNFMTLGTNGRIFLEILFANIILQCKEGGPQAIANVFGKINQMRTLAQGCIFFMQESVVTAKHLSLDEQDMETVRWGCKVAREVLSK
ncbi:uncharacterized protein BYT42DRAFT_508027 [Radiomyces spectabilis]|uniref:uncharacterized protein n=1 Tax=Radiomyces spectabilis TaxID=64574 RepID=UPI002220AA5B|nr:uncharacterized protein BYT42DRAFT_508027 [Radiomyces spectabilis]KAI8394084.1 hypothetical protein BYT42DRAFT_508027 [Radiomyces spectabilis]